MSFDQSQIRAGTYVGKVERLRGERALVRPGRTPDTVLAQFDSYGALLGDRILSYGWHTFPADAFDLDLDLDLEWTDAD